MRRPNKPTKRKQRRNAFGQFAKKKPRTARVKSKAFVSVRWECSPEAGWRPVNALQADLERSHTLPEPLRFVVQQQPAPSLWQRLCGLLRGRM